MGTLVSVNVGMPKNVQWHGKTVYTGIWKTPVEGPVTVRRLNIEGDGQGDLGGHGGEQRAVMVYQVESYEFWRSFLGRDDLITVRIVQPLRSSSRSSSCAMLTRPGERASLHIA